MMKIREKVEAGLYSDMPVLGDSLHHFELNYHGYERQPVEINTDSLVAEQTFTFPVNKSRGIFPFQYIGISVDNVIAGVIVMNGSPAITEQEQVSITPEHEVPLFVRKTFKPYITAPELTKLSAQNGVFDPDAVGVIK